MIRDNRKYPKFIGVNLEEKTYQQLCYAAKGEERAVSQQARYWIKQGLNQWMIFRVSEFIAGRCR